MNSCLAAELVNFDRKDLGLMWDSTPADLERRYRGLKQLSPGLYVYTGVVTLGELTISQGSISFQFDRSQKLAWVSSGFQPDQTPLVLNVFTKRLGSGRWASFPHAPGYQHAYEWMHPSATVELQYTAAVATQSAKPLSPHVAPLRISRDKPRVSQVDVALAYAKQTGRAHQAPESNARPRPNTGAANSSARGGSTATSTVVSDMVEPLRTKAGSTQGSVFNPRGDSPLNSFKAFYFDTRNPKVAIATENVRSVAINYAFDQFHGIKSENFGAYWVGRMRMTDAESRFITIGQSMSNTRLIVDGLVIYEGGDDATIPYRFTKGDHLIEVEYTNRYHTTSLRVGFARERPISSTRELQDEIAKLAIRNAKIHYVGIYESKARDISVTVDVTRLTEDIVLVLSSRWPVEWRINNPFDTKIRGVVYASLKPGSEVVGVDTRRTQVTAYRGEIGSYDAKPRCSCTAGRFHCEGSESLLSTKRIVESITGSSLVSYHTVYSAERLSVPGQLVTPESLRTIEKEIEMIETRRTQCVN